jgi:ATP-dependent Clp protease adaptor protein ClpS
VNPRDHRLAIAANGPVDIVDGAVLISAIPRCGSTTPASAALSSNPGFFLGFKTGNAHPISMSDIERKDDQGGGNDAGTGVVIQTKPRTKKPSMYKVLMLNDDYTPMEFVVHILERFFAKSREEATTIMLHVHRRGVGVCGVFTYEVAETKVAQVMDFARRNQHPLQCILEKA